MRILIIHTFYQQKGGEDTVFQQEFDLLNQSEQVKALTFHNLSGWRGALTFAGSVWNIFAFRKISKSIAEFRPEVIHIHNWHFATGPLAIRAAKKKGIPVVLTLHNYRLLCPSATLFNNGHIYTKSLNVKFPWDAIGKRVYRHSLIQTFWLAFVVWFHKKSGTWQMVDKYIVLTDFARQLFVHSSFGISENKYVIKPNFVRRQNTEFMPRGNHFLYIGRLTEEKGIHLLLNVFEQIDFELYIAGDGPLKKTVEEYCHRNHRVKYIGVLNHTEVQKAFLQCSALVFPSVWYEGMPMTIVEAFATGTPVIATNHGAMASMIQHGFSGHLFDSGNIKSLREQLNNWQNLPKSEKENYYRNALWVYETYFTPDANRQQLISIYQSVLNQKTRR